MEGEGCREGEVEKDKTRGVHELASPLYTWSNGKGHIVHCQANTRPFDMSINTHLNKLT